MGSEFNGGCAASLNDVFGDLVSNRTSLSDALLCIAMSTVPCVALAALEVEDADMFEK